MTINQIINTYYQDCIQFAIHLSGNYHLGHDLVQGMMLKLIERSESMDISNDQRIKAWMFRSIKNAYIDEYRKVKKLIYDMDDRRFDSFEESKMLEMTIETLVYPQKDILKYKYLHGFTSKEISEMMNINDSTIRNHLSRGLNNLRKYYKE